MGRIKKSRSMISNSSNYSNKNLLTRSRSPKKIVVDMQSENIINIQNINKLFFIPLLNRDIHLTIDSRKIISILESTRKFDPTSGIVTDFLINAVSIGENNLKLYLNAELSSRLSSHNEKKIQEYEKTIRILEAQIKNIDTPLDKAYAAINVEINKPTTEVIPLLSQLLAKRAGNSGLFMAYYYAFYHAGYDINAPIVHDKLKFVIKLLESIGLTPDPSTGISPAFIALQELEQTLSQ